MKVLDGVLVLDLGSFITGPYAAMLLADLGADVIKVEKPVTGDPFRSFQQGNYSVEFQAHNRNKRSVVLDYTTEEGYGLLQELVRSADVAIVNARPGIPALKRIGYDDLSGINPKLIYCEVTGFGPNGPYARRPAFDTVGQSLSSWITLFHDGSDSRVAGPAVCDSVTAMYAAYGVLGALFQRERTGKGRRVELNMLQAMISFGTEPLIRYFATGTAPGPYTRASMSQAFILTCKDGERVGLHMSSPEKFWFGLLRAIERPELNDDPRFSTRDARVANYAELGRELEESFLNRDRAEWMRRLEENDVPFSAVCSIEELREDPQIAALAPFYETDHEEFGPVSGIHRPVSYDGDRNIDLRPPPALGEHTSEILRSIGVSAEDEEALRDKGIV